jgi:hypothetical protein
MPSSADATTRFFNDLTGFFRSINYAPQFYHVPHTMPDVRELKIPKTFLELEGNDLFITTRNSRNGATASRRSYRRAR